MYVTRSPKIMNVNLLLLIKIVNFVIPNILSCFIENWIIKKL